MGVPGSKATRMLAAAAIRGLERRGEMGLGADTIDAFNEGPYRRSEQMRVRSQKIVEFIAASGSGLNQETLRMLALHVPQLDVFEAVASGCISSEHGAMVLTLRREAEHAQRPWVVRLFLWLVAMFSGGEAT